MASETAADENPIEQPPTFDDESQILENICILPPRLVDSVVSKEQLARDAILLPPIFPTEPVSAIRGAIGDIRGYAHITNYRLVVEEIDDDLIEMIQAEQENRLKTQGLSGSLSEAKAITDKAVSNANNANGKKNKKKKAKAVPANDVVSAYTCSQKSVSVPSSALSDDGDEIVLNDYDFLLGLVENGLLHSNMGLRMVLERYDAGGLKDHLAKTRMLLDGNAPHALGLAGPFEIAAEDEKSEQQEKDEKDATKIDGDVKDADKPAEEVVKQAKIDPLELNVPVFPLNESVQLDGENLEDFYYLASGEEERLAIVKGKDYLSQSIDAAQENEAGGKIVKKKSAASKAHELGKHLVQLGKKCRVHCTAAFGGFNPPPADRRMLGDLAYVEVNLPGGEGVVHITAIPTGFYVNRSSGDDIKFDPAPAAQPCFSHELLDCLLMKSPSLRHAWAEALSAALERSELVGNDDSPLNALFLAATQNDLGNDSDAETQKALDAVTLRSSWLVPCSRGNKTQSSNHSYNLMRSEDEAADTFGLEIRNGASRDWNEELQAAREMSRDTIDQRIDRARMVHKTLCDFGDASVAGVMAIFKGQIGPMNPNESVRSHVYLHNNIFFSRAVDSGVDTFKVAQGDDCAKKSAARDAQCVGVLHKLDIPGMHTLATVLVDYLGTRMVCQSIVPGILLGEKTHKILYGAVDAASPLAWDKDMHEMLESNLGRTLMIASRKMLRMPLDDERMENVGTLHVESATEEAPEDDILDYFGSVEMKGICGSDHRTYCLDVTRFTPRDANWVPSENGGTGNWEGCIAKNGNKNELNLGDDEWVMHVLRPELIVRFTTKKMRDYNAAKKESKKEENSISNEKSKETDDAETKKDLEYLRTLRLNLNVFLPHLKSIEEEDNEAFEQLKKDEEFVKEIASYLWDNILPQITKEIKESPGQMPVDGKSLTEYLHERGVNCRYLGRLAILAVEEEIKDINDEKDLLAGKVEKIPRRTMPLCWLEMLECEMIARAAKHVLSGYLIENGGSAASQLSKTIACFLSALMSTSEESAAETERRLEKQDGIADEKTELTVFDGANDAAKINGRDKVWADIEREIVKRFGYSLCLYNKKDEVAVSRTSLTPVLRRVCKRSGIRLYAKNYDIGGKGLCSVDASYPITASDIFEVLPMVKQAANDGRESFVPASRGADAANSSLHVLLADAKQAYDGATMLLNEKSYSHALEYIQEATNLYQRVTESPLHTRISKCLDLTTLILYQAKEFEMSAAHAGKALAVAIQISGFDSAEAVAARTTLAHIMLQNGHLASSIKHTRAVIYLTQLLAGPHHIELSTMYHKFAGIYSDIGNVFVSLRFLQAAITKKNNDRVLQAVMNRQIAQIYARLGQFQGAVEMEKQTYHIFRFTLGDDHEFTKGSKEALQQYFLASQERNKIVLEQESKQKAEDQANAIADEIVANEISEEKKKTKKKSKSKSKKKK